MQWVLLSYRMPRAPSSPRIAVWRWLKSLGVAQLGDGLVALPADARTREQLEWVAEDVEQAGGSAMLWTALPESDAHERRIAAEMAAARSEEYRQLCEEAAADGSSLRRLRGTLRHRAPGLLPPAGAGTGPRGGAGHGRCHRRWRPAGRVRLLGREGPPRRHHTRAGRGGPSPGA